MQTHPSQDQLKEPPLGQPSETPIIESAEVADLKDEGYQSARTSPAPQDRDPAEPKLDNTSKLRATIARFIRAIDSGRKTAVNAGSSLLSAIGAPFVFVFNELRELTGIRTAVDVNDAIRSIPESVSTKQAGWLGAFAAAFAAKAFWNRFGATIVSLIPAALLTVATTVFPTVGFTAGLLPTTAYVAAAGAALAMLNAGLISGEFKAGKKYAEKILKDRYLGTEVEADAKKSIFTLAGLKYTARSRMVDVLAIVAGLAQATYGLFVAQTTADVAAAVFVAGVPTASALSTVAKSAGKYAVMSAGTTLTALTAKETYDTLTTWGSKAGSYPVKPAFRAASNAYNKFGDAVATVSNKAQEYGSSAYATAANSKVGTKLADARDYVATSRPVTYAAESRVGSTMLWASNAAASSAKSAVSAVAAEAFDLVAPSNYRAPHARLV